MYTSIALSDISLAFIEDIDPVYVAVAGHVLLVQVQQRDALLLGLHGLGPAVPREGLLSVQHDGIVVELVDQPILKRLQLIELIQGLWKQMFELNRSFTANYGRSVIY